MHKKYVIGLDLGGTKIAAALCDINGDIIYKTKVETDAPAGKDQAIQKIKDSISAVMNESGIELSRVAAIGLCAPGPLDICKGIIVYIATLNWKYVPIVKLLNEEFGLPVYLEKDCNAAAYGELQKGAGRGLNNIIYVTVSTGIGSGIIVNGRIYHGKHGFAGEFGHICLESSGRMCSCGNMGCLQAYASGTSIAEIARDRAKDRNDSLLHQSMQNVRLTSKEVAIAARENDPLAIEIWKDMGRHLGQGISVLMQQFDPDSIIIGGSVSKAWDLFYESMVSCIQEHTYREISKDMSIIPAELGEDAGTIGAALLAKIMN